MPAKSSCFCIFLAALLYPSALIANVNILVNPGFEDGTTGWSGFGCNISAVTEPHSGAYSALVTNRTDTWNGIKQSMLGLINDGQTCTISGWVKLQSNDSNSVRITIKQTDDSGTKYYFIDSANCNNNTWTYIFGDFVLDVNGILSDLFLYFEGPEAGINFYVDDVALTTSSQEPNYATGQIEATIRHQEIEGFGASGAWYEGWLTAHPKKAELYDILFGQLGLDIYRIRNTYDISQNNIDNSAEIVAQGQASLGRELKIMISSWSPPAYLKSDSNTVNGTLAKDSNGSYIYEEFAQWWAQSLVAYEANGITADYVNMQNEPDCLPNWDSCRFRPTETQDWAGYNLAFDALADELNSMQNPPKLLAPETCNISRELNNHYLDYIIDNNQLYGYAHHLYGDGDSNNPDSYIPNMTNFANLYSDKSIFQTEYHFGREDFDAALDLAEIMHNSLTIEQVSAYLHWELFWEDKGLVSLEWPWGSNPGYTINPIYYAFKHYSAFIHSGWKRLETTIDSSNPKISAYISPDNQQLTVVLINTSSDVNVTVDLSFDNFTITDGNVYRTSSAESCSLVGNFDPNNELILPVESITTLALSGTLNLTNCQQVQDLGLALSADLNGDCYVDIEDLSILAEQWMSNNPFAMPPNYSPDIYSDNKISLLDFSKFAIDWFSCNNPVDANCP